jgi:hypothetical protein
MAAGDGPCALGIGYPGAIRAPATGSEPSVKPVSVATAEAG